MSRFNQAVNNTMADDSLTKLLSAYNKARLVAVDALLAEYIKKDSAVSFTKSEQNLIQAASTKTHLLASPEKSVAWYSDVITLAAQSAPVTERYKMEEKGADFIFAELRKRDIKI